MGGGGGVERGAVVKYDGRSKCRKLVQTLAGQLSQLGGGQRKMSTGPVKNQEWCKIGEPGASFADVSVLDECDTRNMA